jgi:hypothetical protein
MRLPRPAPGPGHLLPDGGETPGDREAAARPVARSEVLPSEDLGTPGSRLELTNDGNVAQ